MIAHQSRGGGRSSLGRPTESARHRSRRRSVGLGPVRSRTVTQNHAFSHVGTLNCDLWSDCADLALRAWERFGLRRYLGAVAVPVRLPGRPDGQSP